MRSQPGRRKGRRPRQRATRPSSPRSEPTSISFRVDVIVNDENGDPVTDLTEADFEVFEDGELQTIEQFRLIQVDGNPPPGAPAPRQLSGGIEDGTELSRDDVRLFVFFFDDYHVRLSNAVAVKEPLIRFVQTQLRPNDIVGIMYPLTPLDGISFTRNPATVVSAIERFEGRKFRLPSPQHSRGAVRARPNGDRRADSQSGGHGRA